MIFSENRGPLCASAALRDRIMLWEVDFMKKAAAMNAAAF
jgi:hypothetical protein